MHETNSVTFLTIDITLMILVTVLNLLVIFILIVKANVRKSKTIFLLSLAFADMFVGIFVIPNAISIMYLHVKMEDFVCKLCYYGEHTMSAASALSISVIAVDRMRAILFPLKFKSVHRGFSYLVLALVWILALLYALRTPFVYGAVTRISEVTDSNVTVSKTECTIMQGQSMVHQGLIYLDFFVLFLLPSTVLVTCNVAVSIRLAAVPTIQATGRTRLLMKRRRSIRLLLAMIFLFVGCHLPLYSFQIHLLIATTDVYTERVIMQSLLILSWSNSLLNVLFYGSLNDDVKSTLAMIIRCQCRKRNNRVAISTIRTTRRQHQSTMAAHQQTTISTTVTSI
ncbi:adenosine receptor A3-like [Mizuhopecten yessoensis]|uniref:Adenosine receptor A2b n=1 Tax=Mizuhopecten yessoensis TaxID=6573 RepID=A0A210R2H9_MIZYE|nr:adenosine receptor A3-like [Mizuhopecten yessoensis]OWF55248.1 Adenosine receptor A2b [Mizuhopecten yessoensis]